MKSKIRFFIRLNFTLSILILITLVCSNCENEDRITRAKRIKIPINYRSSDDVFLVSNYNNSGITTFREFETHFKKHNIYKISDFDGYIILKYDTTVSDSSNIITTTCLFATYKRSNSNRNGINYRKALNPEIRKYYNNNYGAYIVKECHQYDNYRLE